MFLVLHMNIKYAPHEIYMISIFGKIDADVAVFSVATLVAHEHQLGQKSWSKMKFV